LKKNNLPKNHKSYYDFQSLSDVYLNSENINSNDKKGDWKTIKIFLAIAILILLVAIINYIILSTAVSSRRAKEIGIRKTFGAKNNQLKYQFLIESVVLSIIVLPIAILLMILGLPYTEQLFQTKLPIIISNIPYYLTIYISLTIITGLASGFYTSVGLSRINAIQVLKLEILQGKKKNFVRSSLIIFQLIIFCFFVTCALIIQAQYKFAINKNPGFQNKNILLVNISDLKYYNAFLNEINANSNVISTSGAKSGLPMLNSMSIALPNQKNKEQRVPTEVMIVDYGFLKTMDIKLLHGRYFSIESENASKTSCILNETAIQALGLENPIGYQLEEYNIIGVVKDFYLHSFHSEIPPVLIVCNKNYLDQIAIRYKEGTQSDVVKALHKSWNKLGSDQKFDFVTIENIIKELYSGEKNKLNIISIVAFFTMLIASFGLFGLSLFIAQSRTKEIGIKKVLGCSNRRIIFSFIRTNIVHVAIASIISIPITFYVMQKWLNNYAVRTDIEWWFFLFSFLIACIVVILTVFIHSYKAASVNPIESLKYE
jgi:ABC-type transport system, involved in lipoprotein release, permease component